MSRPDDPPGAVADLTSEIHNLSDQTSDQVCPEKVERREADDADAVRNAKTRIADATDFIRTFQQQPYASAPKLPRAASLRLPKSDTVNGPPTTSAPPPVKHFAGFQAHARSSLDPEIVPPPPNGTRRLFIGPLLARSALMIGLAAIVAYGIAMFSPFQLGSHWSKVASESAGSVAAVSSDSGQTPQALRFFAEDHKAFANEPILLGVAVLPATANGWLSIGGLAHGARLTAGVALSDDRWELPLHDIGGAFVYAPANFVGVMNAMIALLAPSRRVIDSRPMRLEWLTRADLSRPTGNGEVDSMTVTAVPKEQTKFATLSVPGNSETGSGAAGEAAVKPMDQREATALMERGLELLKDGDVSSAQLAFRRLADAGRADAALALATTYDPRYLAEHKILVIVGDETQARAWYQRAKELGSTEAERILQRADLN